MKRAIRTIMSCLALALILATGAAGAPAGDLATLEGGPTAVEWRPTVAGVGLTLTVAGPDGFYLKRELAAGESATFSLFDEEGAMRPDGVYVYELRPVFHLDEATRAELEPMRGGEGMDSVLASKSKVANGHQVGSFSILDGALVLPGLEEQAPAAGDGNEIGRKVVLTNANGVIRNALCVGFDCPDSPAFGDSSVLMMENNNRIKFGDTSNAPFPNSDWEIEANSNASGGPNYLAFNDCGPNDNDGGCTTDLVFGVEAGARQRALWVDSAGDVGVGTATPALEMHLVRGDSPGLRLEQDTSSGFGAQTWDIVGNETSFFVRDATNASTLPFRIFPDNASNILVVRDDRVGAGTLSPAERLHVQGSDGNTQFLVEETSGTASTRTMIRMVNNGGVRLAFNDMNITAAGGNLSLNPNNSVNVNGDFSVTGVKNFAAPDPKDPTRAFYYAALEGPEAGTYYRGEAKTVDGVVEIALPRSFTELTEAEGMTVQLTPIGGWGRLYVQEATPGKLVVRVFEGEDMGFYYLVQGVRKGYADYQVERPNGFLP